MFISKKGKAEQNKRGWGEIGVLNRVRSDVEAKTCRWLKVSYESTQEGVCQQGQNSEGVRKTGQASWSMGAVGAASFIIPPAIRALHLFLLVEWQHFRTEQRSDAFVHVL